MEKHELIEVCEEAEKEFAKSIKLYELLITIAEAVKKYLKETSK